MRPSCSDAKFHTFRPEFSAEALTEEVEGDDEDVEVTADQTVVSDDLDTDIEDDADHFITTDTAPSGDVSLGDSTMVRGVNGHVAR